MPFDVRIHPAHQLAVVRFSEQDSGNDVLGSVKATLADGWEPGWSIAVDLRPATSFRITEADAGRIGKVIARIPLRDEGGRTVFLVRGSDGDAAARRILRITGAHVERERRIHYNTVAAAEWLGVPPELIDSPGA